jgi:hypothetical protein
MNNRYTVRLVSRRHTPVHRGVIRSEYELAAFLALRHSLAQALPSQVIQLELMLAEELDGD